LGACVRACPSHPSSASERVRSGAERDKAAVPSAGAERVPSGQPCWRRAGAVLAPCLAPVCENFLYVFKGARSAPRAWRRVTAHAVTAAELAHSEKRALCARREPAAPPGGRSP
jgi:hypothetical protein